MITKEKALEIAKKFLRDKQIEFVGIAEDKILYKEKYEIPVGKYADKIRKTFSICYYLEGFNGDIMYAIYIDAETGEILFIMTPHRFIEPQDC